MSHQYYDATANFEKGRIKQLQEERIYIQKKTFTKWMNSYLNKAGLEVNDLFKDLADGRMLLKLLEIISGDRIGKPNRGHLRVHKIENLNKSLNYLSTKVRLESIGAEDIVDGNPTLILGLIWTVILRFQIQEIEVVMTRLENISAEDVLDENPTIILGLIWTTILRFQIEGIQDSMREALRQELPPGLTLADLGLTDELLEELRRAYPGLFDVVGAALPADFGPDTRLGDLPQELTLRDLGVKPGNLPPGASPTTTLAELPPDLTLRGLGFGAADMPEVRDRIGWAQQIRHGVIYRDATPADLSASTRLAELPRDMTVRDLGVAAAERVPENVPPDTPLGELPGELTLRALGVADADARAVRDAATRNYQLRHAPVFVDVTPDDLSPATSVADLPPELTLEDLGCAQEIFSLKGFSPEDTLGCLPRDVTVGDLGFARKEDVPALREHVNKNYALRRNPAHANAIRADVTPDAPLRRLRPDMTLADLGLSDADVAALGLPEGTSSRTRLEQMPEEATLRSLGFAEADMPALREAANRAYLARCGLLYRNVVPANLGPETSMKEMPQEMTLRELGVTEADASRKVNLDRPVAELPPQMKMKDVGVTTKTRVGSVREHAVHAQRLTHGPLHWDVLPVEMHASTKLRELPRDMTLRDLGVTQAQLPREVPVDTPLSRLPAHLTLGSLDFADEDMARLRQAANRNYQRRRGPTEVTAATRLDALPTDLTLAQLGVSDDALARLPSWVTRDTTLGDLRGHLTLADLGVAEDEAALERVRRLVRPEVHGGATTLMYNGVPVSADMRVVDLPPGLTLEDLGVDSRRLEKYYAAKRKIPSTTTLAEMGISGDKLQQLLLTHPGLFQADDDVANLLPADLSPLTPACHLPHEMTLGDLWVAELRLPARTTRATTLGALPRHVTLHALGFADADVAAAKDAVHRWRHVRRGPLYRDAMPAAIGAATALRELPADMTLEDLGVAASLLPRGVAADARLSSLPRDLALADLGFADGDARRLRDAANRSYQLRHRRLYVDVTPADFSVETTSRELPRELTLGELGVGASHVLQGASLDTTLEELPGELTMRGLGFEDADVPALRDRINQRCALHHSPVNGRAIPVDATADLQICNLPRDMTLQDLGIIEEQVPEGLTIRTPVGSLPQHVTLRDLGYADADIAELVHRANKAYQNNRGNVYSNVLSRDLSVHTALNDLPSELTLRQIGLTEAQVDKKFSVDKPLSQLPQNLTLTQLGAQANNISGIAARIIHSCQVIHGPIYWDVMPIELSPETTLNALPQDMTLGDLGVRKEHFLPGSVESTSISELDGEITLQRLGFTEADMMLLRQRANQNYQLRRGPLDIASSTLIRNLPEHLTLGELGSSRDAMLLLLPSWVTENTALYELPADLGELTLADLGIESGAALERVVRAVKPALHARDREAVFYGGTRIHSDMSVADLPADLTLEMLGVDVSAVAKYYAAEKRVPTHTTLAELGITAERIQQLMLARPDLFESHEAIVVSDLRPDTQANLLPRYVTLRDLGVTAAHLPDGATLDTRASDLPRDVTLRSLGFAEADTAVSEAVSEAVRRASRVRHGALYRDALPASLSADTALAAFPADMTFGDLSLDLAAGVSPETLLSSLPAGARLRDFGVSPEDVRMLRDRANRNYQMRHAAVAAATGEPMLWDVLPVRLREDTLLSELPRDMTLNDLGIAQRMLPRDVSADTCLSRLPAGLAVSSLGFRAEDIAALRCDANANYQLRRGPAATVTAATSVDALPQEMTLAELGVTGEGLAHLPAWAGAETRLYELPGYLTLAELSLRDEASLSAARRALDPAAATAAETAAVVLCNGVVLSPETRFAELPPEVTLRTLGVEDRELARFVVDEEDETSERKSAKEALLLWCKRRTDGHKNCEITNFSGSWRDGMGFNALIHAHRPDLIAYERLNPDEHIHNLNQAFDIGEKELGIPRLLDAEDVDVKRPDEKSIMTYVASYYHTFAKLRDEATSGRRIAKIVKFMMECDKQKDDYEKMSSDLILWVQQKVALLNDRRFPNSMEGIQQELVAFKEYRTVEKPPKFKQKGDLEVNLFNLQTKLKSEGRKPYMPPERMLVSDIERAWEELEKAEHARELALREELQRQERLEQLAEKFERKAGLRESWLQDMNLVLDDMNIGSSASQVELAAKRHETITTEVLARKDRFHLLTNMAKELIQANFHGSDKIKLKQEQISTDWNTLLDKLKQRKHTLQSASTLMGVLRDVESLQIDMKHLEANVQSKDFGKQLMAVEDLLQKHKLTEGEVASLGEQVNNINRKAAEMEKVGDSPVLKRSLEELNASYDSLCSKSGSRREGLDESLKFFRFMEDAEQEESWLTEKQRVARSPDVGNDLKDVLRHQQQHEALEAEMQVRAPISNAVCIAGDELVKDGHPRSEDIEARINALQKQWDRLKNLVAAKRARLEDAAESAQFYNDVEDAELWMRERMPLAASDDFGKDEEGAQALLLRHRRLEGEIKSYDDDMQRLNNLATLMTKDSKSHNITPETAMKKSHRAAEEEEVEENGVEYVDVPYEVEGEELVEREVLKEVVEEKNVPQVKATFPYTGHGMQVLKGEVLMLLRKTNQDWWNVRRENGQEGYVPANYCNEVAPRKLQRVVKRPVKVQEKVKVKKTAYKTEARPAGKKLRRTPSVRSVNNLHFDKENVEKKQKHANDTYKKLCKLAQARHMCLEDAMKLYRFYRECDDFDWWMADKEKAFSNDDPTENIETRKRRYEKLLTDLAANSGRPDQINKIAEDILVTSHTIKEPVKKRQKEINDRWKNLNKLRLAKEKSLEGASSLDLFDRKCADTMTRIDEKSAALDNMDTGRSLQAVRSLQKQHENIARELRPVQDEMKKIGLLSATVQSAYPEQAKHVSTKEGELQKAWNALAEKADTTKAQMEESHGQRIFIAEADDLMNWAEGVKDLLRQDERASDVATAEDQLKRHQDLADDIKAHEDTFDKVDALGAKLLKKAPQSAEVKGVLQRVQNAQSDVTDGWKDKQQKLLNNLDLQLFNREADQVDSVTGGHERYLDVQDLGGSIDDVEKLIKRHEDFDNKLYVQDERVKQFSEMADKLLHAQHPENKYIHEKRVAVKHRRQDVKRKSKGRREVLHNALAFQEFKRDAEELATWMYEKRQMAADESYRDPTHLQRKLQKHQAFLAELKANEDRLDTINQNGQALIKAEHYAQAEVQEILDDLNHQWTDLCSLAADKQQKLQQAAAQKDLYGTLEEGRKTLDEMERALATDDVGKDLRSARDMLAKHQMLEQDIERENEKVKGLNATGQELAQAGHFNTAKILEDTEVFSKKFDKLQGPSTSRRETLETSLQYHQFVFDVDNELQWIHDHVPSATSSDYGKSLFDAQNLYTKHQKFKQELHSHQPFVERRLVEGEELVAGRHPNARDIRDKCYELRSAWDGLLDGSAAREKKLELSLGAQKFYSDAAEIEQWINEKQRVCSSEDCGKNEVAANRLLTKHKALEVEIDSYMTRLSDLKQLSQKLLDSGHPDSKSIGKKTQQMEAHLNNLKKMATARKRRLEDARDLFEYVRESEDFEQWIAEKLQQAQSEDYGQDFEHVQELHNKYDEFKLQVEAGGERYAQCQKLAERLIDHQNPHADDIKNRQQQLKEAWQSLLKSSEERDNKLQAAGEIHRFNRDVGDSLSRIQEKYASIPDDLGRDLNGVQSLLRKHEAFENDLVALEGQLQVLLDDSVRLCAQHPGGNADDIKQQQAIVVENWNNLQERAGQRREELQMSCDLHRFMANARDLTSWANETQTAMAAEQPARDLAGVQAMKKNHDELKAEIDARDEAFATVMQAAKMMKDGGHYAGDEITARAKQTLDAKTKLDKDWKEKAERIQELLKQQQILRDAKQLDSTSATQEAYLSSAEIPTTVQEVEGLLKRHFAFENLLQTQDDKVKALHGNCQELHAQKHAAAPAVLQVVQEVSARRGRVKELSDEKKNKLQDALLYAQLNRDYAETSAWIASKQKMVEEPLGEVTSLQDKMKKLQKHQAVEAEIAANEPRIDKIKEAGETLVAKKHPESEKVKTQTNNLLAQWRDLRESADNRAKVLEEARDILEFNSQVEKVEAWMRDKTVMIQAGDTGRDYEHCLELQKKMDDKDSAVHVNADTIKAVNKLGDRLVHQGRSDTREVQAKQQQLNNKWDALQGALESHKAQLAGALEVHAFIRDCNEVKYRINEKALAFQVEDCGKDLDGVETLQRKQDADERGMTAIYSRIQELNEGSKKLQKKHPNNVSTILDKQTEVANDWHRLIDLSKARKDKLAASYSLQKFNSDLKELETWVNSMLARMTSGDMPKDISEAESVMELHQERKAEIDGREEGFDRLRNYGRNLINERHYASEDVHASLTFLDELQQQLKDTWQERNRLLQQSYDLQVFKDCAEQGDAWLASKEAFLNNEDLGDSISDVKALLKKHEDFEKSLQTQGEKIATLEQLAADLVRKNHFDSDGITARSAQVTARRDRLLAKASARTRKLEDSMKLQKFLRNAYDVTNWMQEKMQMACDESYREPVNLQSKIQKHQAFEAELQANKGRITAVKKEGERLIADEHYLDDLCASTVQTLQNSWETLTDTSNIKKERLQDAYQALLFNRAVDDLDAWCDDVEGHLASEDHGRDLTSVKKLLKKHQRLETDITNHLGAIKKVEAMARGFDAAGHFMNDDIQARAKTIIDRYYSLREPAQIRRENLEDAKLLQQFARDVEEEVSWIEEKLPLARSADLGNSLTAVTNLQKKHQALEAEIVSHEPGIETITTSAEHMISGNHFAAGEVQAKLNTLLRALQDLKDSSAERQRKLLDAVESHTFYTEVNEALQWINEKTPLLTNKDLGKDEDSVQSLMKKLDAVDVDIDNFSNNVNKLAILSQGLVKRGHFDSDNIRHQQEAVEARYGELRELAARRRHLLTDNRHLLQFEREAEELEAWMTEKEALAAAEDYGRDVEHVQVLQEKYEHFMDELRNQQRNLEVVVDFSKQLRDGGHPNAAVISDRTAELNQQWSDLKELAQARHEALEGAKQVHTFDHDTDELVSWIHEKEAMLITEDYGQDLDAVEALERRHLAFEQDLHAVGEQVDSVKQTAARLGGEFPDAAEHIRSKQEEAGDAWSALLAQTEQKKSKLVESENLQSYFSDFRELMAWINEMMAIITSDELARDVPGAEALIEKHKEHRAAIDMKMGAFEKFTRSGEDLIARGHFLSDDIRDKIQKLDGARDQLLDTWQQRSVLYDQNLDAQMFKRDAEALQSWLRAREPVLRDANYGQSVKEVDELIQRHEDFEKTVESQRDRFQALNRETLLEKTFRQQRENEEKRKLEDEKKKNQNRLDAIKLKEQERILDERRKAQEERHLRRPAEAEEGRMVKEETAQATEYRPVQGAPREEHLKKSPGSPTKTPREVKRTDSAKEELKRKKDKRTPSFTTRRRTTSFKKAKVLESLPPVVREGQLERKHEFQSGRKKATLRSWKSFYVVLCGDLLCFFKDKEHFEELSSTAATPLVIHRANVTVATDYTKKKHVFRLQLLDGAEFLFQAPDEGTMMDWITRIERQAAIAPTSTSHLMNLSVDQATTSSAASSVSVSPQKKKQKKRWPSGGSSSDSGAQSTPETAKRTTTQRASDGGSPSPARVSPPRRSRDETDEAAAPPLPAGRPPSTSGVTVTVVRTSGEFADGRPRAEVSPERRQVAPPERPQRRQSSEEKQAGGERNDGGGVSVQSKIAIFETPPPPLSPQDGVHDVTVNIGGAGEHTVRVDASERRSSRPEIPPPLPPNLPPPAPPKGYEDDEWPDSNTVVPPPPGYEGAVNGDRDHTVQDTSKPQWRSSTLPVGGAPPRQGDVDRYATTERPVSSVSLESSVEGDKKKHKSVFRGWFHRKSKDKDGKGDQMSDLKADRV